MVPKEIAPALRERLGPDGTLGLVAVFDAARKAWSAEVIDQALDRIDRKLTTEMSQLRGELKQDIHELRVEIKQEMHELRVELKGDISKLDGSVKDALLQQTRWIFGMWVGQLGATAAIVAAMFRIYSP